MTEEEKKSFIQFLYKELKFYCQEMLAYRLFAETLKANGVRGVDAMIRECRESATLKKKIEDYFPPLEETLLSSGADFQERVKQLLENWKPTGRPN